jgi:hypothetical protein
MDVMKRLLKLSTLTLSIMLLTACGVGSGGGVPRADRGGEGSDTDVIHQGYQAYLGGIYMTIETPSNFVSVMV